MQFYGTDASLFATVAGFLSEGLIAGQPAIIIATQTHRTSLLQYLSSRLIAVDEAQQAGELVLFDAEEMLSAFMVDGEPDGDRFEESVGAVIDRTLTRHQRSMLRAYGEMVDVLWQRGESEAAIKLEMLWNKLAVTRGFALLCGYSMGSFYKQTGAFQRIVEQHTHVHGPEPNVVILDAKRRSR